MRRGGGPTELHAAESSGERPPRKRWSNGHRAFILALAVTLAVTATLVIRHATRYSALCVPHTPALAHVAPGEATALRSELAALVTGARGRVYARGEVPTSVVWTDNAPGSLVLKLSGGRGPGGYELRSWAPDPWWGTRYRDDFVADAFAFGTPQEAAAFFRRDSAVGCHRSAIARHPRQLPQASELAWVNPDGVAEDDLLIMRGSTVYRLVVVRPGASSDPPRWNSRHLAGAVALERAACARRWAGCTLSAAAYFRERVRVALCTLNGELTSEYGTTGPWALKPIRARTQAIVARAVARLIAIQAPAELSRGHVRLTTSLAALLRLGRLFDATPSRVRGPEYLARMPIYQNLFFVQARRLHVDECVPIEPRHPLPGAVPPVRAALS